MAASFLAWGLVCLFVGGCASASRPSTSAQITSAVPQTNSVTPVSSPTNGAATATLEGRQDPADVERLTRLWQARTHGGGASSDYPIGPGDVLQITVPGMEELRERTVRVSGDGTISLPLLGLMQVAGLTETGVGDELRRRLEERYMYNPQVNLFVTEYRSRQVAVIGQVGKPGLYSLASDSDTLLDMLSQAGGVTAEAAPRILFIPAEPGEEKNTKELATALPVALDGRDTSPPVLKSTNPIVIDLQDLARGGDQMLLTLPARPGDVLVVPGRGEVLVQGWVRTPASYKITPGLTVLGAVAAAGGLLYAADASTVQIIRSGKKGEKILLAANLETIKRGESPDFPVEPGDVVEVSYSSAKIVPYGVYSFFTSIIRVGANVSYY